MLTGKASGLGVVAMAMAVGLLSGVPTPRAAGAFAFFSGSWSGSGSIRLDDGRSEGLKCRAYYSPKGDQGSGLALRWASSSHKIELAAPMTARGGRGGGHWGERQINAAVTG